MARRRRRDASRTAETVVWLRAMGAEPGSGAVNPDDLAADFLGARLRALRRVPGGWRLARRVFDAMAPGYYAYETARTMHLDSVLRGEMAALEQLVLVGSGYDSRPYRFADALARARIFEIDRPKVLAEKRRRAARAGLDSRGLVDVPVDLERDPFEALMRSGYDPAARTLFMCSGVLMYLDERAVDEFLRFVRAAGAGSSVCFDYVYRSALEDGDRFHGATRMIRNVERMGEPYLFTLDPDELSPFLEQRGCHVISDFDAAGLAAYLEGDRPDRRGTMCDYLGIVHAAPGPTPRPAI